MLYTVIDYRRTGQRNKICSSVQAIASDESHFWWIGLRVTICYVFFTILKYSVYRTFATKATSVQFVCDAASCATCCMHRAAARIRESQNSIDPTWMCRAIADAKRAQKWASASPRPVPGAETGPDAERRRVGGPPEAALPVRGASIWSARLTFCMM